MKMLIKLAPAVAAAWPELAGSSCRRPERTKVMLRCQEAASKLQAEERGSIFIFFGQGRHSTKTYKTTAPAWQLQMERIVQRLVCR